MQPVYVVFIVIFIVLLIQNRNKKIWLKQFLKSKKTEDKTEMLEMAKKFIDKECIIYTFNSDVTGVVKEVSSGAILIERDDAQEAINLDFIIRIREYPRKKNGRKKSLVLD